MWPCDWCVPVFSVLRENVEWALFSTPMLFFMLWVRYQEWLQCSQDCVDQTRLSGMTEWRRNWGPGKSLFNGISLEQHFRLFLDKVGRFILKTMFCPLAKTLNPWVLFYSRLKIEASQSWEPSTTETHRGPAPGLFFLVCFSLFWLKVFYFSHGDDHVPSPSRCILMVSQHLPPLVSLMNHVDVINKSFSVSQSSMPKICHLFLFCVIFMCSLKIKVIVSLYKE